MNAEKLRVLDQENSILNTYLYEIRDVNVQSDRMRFRKNLERIGNILALEISKSLSYRTDEVQTPLGIAQVNTLADEVVVMSILRAGLPLQQGLLNFFDHADAGFIGAYRKHSEHEAFTISMEYFTSPKLEEKVIILCDPMLATGKSFISVLKLLRKDARPKRLILACVISSEEGIKTLHKADPNLEIWTASMDKELTSKGYIVPGLGDAGDLAFGSKEQY